MTGVLHTYIVPVASTGLSSPRREWIDRAFVLLVSNFRNITDASWMACGYAVNKDADNKNISRWIHNERVAKARGGSMRMFFGVSQTTKGEGAQQIVRTENEIYSCFLTSKPRRPPNKLPKPHFGRSISGMQHLQGVRTSKRCRMPAMRIGCFSLNITSCPNAAESSPLQEKMGGLGRRYHCTLLLRPSWPCRYGVCSARKAYLDHLAIRCRHWPPARPNHRAS